MGISHTIIKKDFEDDLIFSISTGIGFVSGRASSVNIEMNNLSLQELKEITQRFQEVVERYENH